MDEITSAFPIINERYQILNTISSGGMAVIYRAKDLLLDREIALKILKLELSRKSNFRDQFSTEAKATAGLSHPNIVTTYDFGLYGDRLFIAMELVEGALLKDLIPDDSITPQDRYKYIRQACMGLSYAHQRNIVHCDIKPQNMLVSNNSILKLTDFGISRAIDSASRISDMDEVWGSPYYIAPETAKGEPPTPASDVYSMGIVMYEIFTKQLPFEGSDVLSLVEKHLDQKPQSPQSINPAISGKLNNIILKAISKKPNQRYADAGELLDALHDLGAKDAFIPVVSKPDLVENESKQTINNSSDEKEMQIDWVTILLGFLALVTVGGLIPFWLFIYFSINR